MPQFFQATPLSHSRPLAFSHSSNILFFSAVSTSILFSSAFFRTSLNFELYIFFRLYRHVFPPKHFYFILHRLNLADFFFPRNAHLRCKTNPSRLMNNTKRRFWKSSFRTQIPKLGKPFCRIFSF